ncbi:GNAT family N-acetyltransferase [Glaciibacter psychrotolerans]|uniref:Ribosomal protein S18 acetylase RimI-like enzyme n=1 Tax=Glaciibacter psychrotolerans TaxID=670054 RepID=A0A7Z0J742_9MICO|nr:GNAT family N-acetyltransferase [Leifsonia psychrotolerans]NYJ21095.1 ribosomal protein S18 acetylase RimI-like enzyme [Leifsonia psychrotolerans]
MQRRIATENDLDRVTETVHLAFLDDPVWSVALARPDGSTEHARDFWRQYVRGAQRYSTVFLVEGTEVGGGDEAAAVAVWLPPGGDELSDEHEAEIERIVREYLEPDAARALFLLWERFEAHHPHDEPHAYLSLLATHPTHRGRGIGQQLLAENLAHFDSAGIHSYLESTNPANNHRYERAGFARIGEFSAVLNEAPVTTMWRSAR